MKRSLAHGNRRQEPPASLRPNLSADRQRGRPRPDRGSLPRMRKIKIVETHLPERILTQKYAPLTRIFELCILQTIEIIRPTAVLTGRQFNSLLDVVALVFTWRQEPYGEIGP